ncbi:MAG: RNase adapter RapZ [Rhodobacteraceae bacterium]|nr:RNase adapter RapZ [Paracoccaceae bacterium]
MSERFAVEAQQMVLVTGPSGSGRSTVIDVLEDLGFETIDNIPLRLLPSLLEMPPAERPMALGIDTRNRDFSTGALMEAIGLLSRARNVNLTVLYLDCAPDVLLRRYSETRRRHPVAPTETPKQGIEREFDLLSAVRDHADTLIDTSDLNVHQLRAEIERWFAPSARHGLAVAVQSFSYKRGLPRGLDLAFDCRFLANPYWVPELRAMDGRDVEVDTHISQDPRFQAFFDKILDFALFMLPAVKDEGKSHLMIGLGCTGGQHRSVAIAERLGKALAEDGWPVSIRHREMERRSAARGSRLM